jgi:hypothetical protein
MGLSKTGCVRSCNRLRCTACDFKVVAVDDYEWLYCSDQLFFRNNVPDLSKLKENLVKKPGRHVSILQSDFINLKVSEDVRLLQSILREYLVVLMLRTAS